ncbi:MAG: hypothetical protein ACI306_01270 [Muribaculaceae bacterium]
MPLSHDTDIEPQLDDILRRAAAGPTALAEADCAVLRRAAADHPAFTLAAALLLKYADSSLTDDERRELRTRVAVNGGDKHAIMALIDPTGNDLRHIYPPVAPPPAVSTNDAIDTFLDTYGHSTPEDDALLERLIFNPTPDYGELLAQEEEQDMPPMPTAGDDSQQARIDSFIIKQKTEHATPPPMPRSQASDAPVSEPEHADDSLLSESLAKIFIKQGRYERAFEIISALSLNYPKKSIYFADQLRFLQKLIKIQQFKATSKQ